jgi:hypothetical protein
MVRLAGGDTVPAEDERENVTLLVGADANESVMEAG